MTHLLVCLLVRLAGLAAELVGLVGLVGVMGVMEMVEMLHTGFALTADPNDYPPCPPGCALSSVAKAAVVIVEDSNG